MNTVVPPSVPIRRRRFLRQGCIQRIGYPWISFNLRQPVPSNWLATDFQMIGDWDTPIKATLGSRL
jgi:hypothetical protein